jgi:hypothetical protein
VSRARKVRKAAAGSPSDRRFNRLFDKRAASDPTFLGGQLKASAPVKYARCTVCVGRPHHAPDLEGGVA